MVLDPTWVKAELKAIRESKDAHKKGKRFEQLLRKIFDQVPGLTFMEPNIMTVYGTQEIDLAYHSAKTAVLTATEQVCQSRDISLHRSGGSPGNSALGQPEHTASAFGNPQGARYSQP
jgi:hypothetical protein